MRIEVVVCSLGGLPGVEGSGQRRGLLLRLAAGRNGRYHRAAMERPSPPSAKLWLLAGFALVVWQAWISLGLFGTDQPWDHLISPDPIVSGRHPLHLYHGWLGVRALLERGTLCVYDPAFQAGYPRTPIFDGGSRPAELFLLLCGGQLCPVTYKLGIFFCCVAAPLVWILAGQWFGLAPGGGVLAGALGMLVWWSVPARRLIDQGDLNLFLMLLAAVSHAGLLIRFHERPGVVVWLGLLLCAGLGWWMMPLLFTFITLPLLLIYYVGTGIRHCLLWHLALAGCLAGGLVSNLFWLTDWVDSLWMRLPVPAGDRLPLDRALLSLLEIDWWGSLAERGLALGLYGVGLLGALVWYGQGRRPAARVLLLALVGILALAVTAGTWEPLRVVGTRRLLVLALGFAVIPAAAAGQFLVTKLHERLASSWLTATVLAALLAPGIWYAAPEIGDLTLRAGEPLQIGLGAERLEMVQLLEKHTSPSARILWEDLPDQPSRWTALLPMLTARTYLGGLDPEATVEHAFAAFVERQLAGRPIQDWSDADLENFCRRYNIGWVVAWSPSTRQRLDEWCRAERASRTVAVTNQGKAGWLYTLKRDHSFVLRGQANFLVADRQRIALTDIVPDADGKIVLSMHYQSGLRVSPSRVQVEPDPDPWDPIPFIRLTVPEPLSVLTLSWENP